MSEIDEIALDTEPTEVNEEVVIESVNTEETPQSEEGESAEKSEDYSELLANDMREISEEFSLGGDIGISDLKNPIRYGALRDLGLSPKEAYLASGGRKEKADNRAHLSSSVPRKMAMPFYEIPKTDLAVARELFSDMSDAEIRTLYKKVTK